ncbi:MAG: helix-turn-helix domain-containing protein [Spirochaetaceae bacterium]|nr:helix-turn-helix domain-containing protein [Spirochaetaceae bacterium]
MDNTEETRQKEQAEEPMNVQEAAAFMKCAVSTIYRDSANGCIPCIRKGRRLLFLKSDLLEWLKRMREIPSYAYPLIMK